MSSSREYTGALDNLLSTDSSRRGIQLGEALEITIDADIAVQVRDLDLVRPRARQGVQRARRVRRKPDQGRSCPLVGARRANPGLAAVDADLLRGECGGDGGFERLGRECPRDPGDAEYGPLDGANGGGNGRGGRGWGRPGMRLLPFGNSLEDSTHG